jgi:hypothetical protein
MPRKREVELPVDPLHGIGKPLLKKLIAGDRKEARKKSKIITWQADELAILERFFPSVPTDRIAAKLNRSYKSVCGKAKQLGLRKSYEFRVLRGRLNSLRRWNPDEDITWEDALAFSKMGIKATEWKRETGPGEGA